MYKHGRPVYKLTRRPLFVIAAILLIAASLGYYFIIRPNTRNEIRNNDTARVTTLKSGSSNDTLVDDTLFSFTLPGPWNLSDQDWDARYHSYQWASEDKKLAGRSFRLYVDTIPKDQAVNYLLPVKVADNTMGLGDISENCVNFTQNAIPEDQRPANIPVNQAALPSRWQLVDFLCDNANITHQVVGASSSAGINTVTLTGPTKGTHKFFFLYRDNNLNADLNTMVTILSSFKVK